MTSTDCNYCLSSQALRVTLLAAACFLLPVAPAFASQDSHESEGGDRGGQSQASSASSASTNSSGGPSTSSPTGSRSSGYVGGGVAEPADLALARAAVADGQALGLAEIMPALRRVASGRVLAVSFGRGNAGFLYTFAVLTDAGRYLDVSIDAKTGALIASRRR
jgi:uncharacterized membrane protein